MIKYITGDILASSEKYIIHGCNCSGGYGSGIAGQIAIKYPKAKYYYREKYNTEGWSLGDIQPVQQWNDVVIINSGTQQKYGKVTEGPYVSYPAIRACIRRALDMFPNEIIAMPKIGAGLAGGNWDIISKIIEEESKDRIIHVYTL